MTSSIQSNAKLPSQLSSRERVVQAVTTPLAFFTLALVVCEAVLAVLAARVTPENQAIVIYAIIIFLVLMVLLVAGLSIWRPEALFGKRYGEVPFSGFARCEVLTTRAQVYEKAAQLLSKAEIVLDTTWGPDPADAGANLAQARDRYRVAQTKAIDRGVEYKELLSATPKREDLIKTLNAEAEQRPNFDIRLVRNFGELPSSINFFIADHRHVVLSHVDPLHPAARHRFLYIDSSALAGTYSGLFSRAWAACDASS